MRLSAYCISRPERDLNRTVCRIIETVLDDSNTHSQNCNVANLIKSLKEIREWKTIKSDNWNLSVLFWVSLVHK